MFCAYIYRHFPFENWFKMNGVVKGLCWLHKPFHYSCVKPQLLKQSTHTCHIRHIQNEQVVITD